MRKLYVFVREGARQIALAGINPVYLIIVAEPAGRAFVGQLCVLVKEDLRPQHIVVADLLNQLAGVDAV